MPAKDPNYHKEYYLRNRNKIIQYGKNYYKNNLEKCRNNIKEYKLNNKEKIKEQYSNYNKNNKHIRRKWVQENRDHHRESVRKWQKENVNRMRCLRNNFYIKSKNNLDDYYIRRLIKSRNKIKVVPQTLIETYRYFILIKREIKNEKHCSS